jgi:two-component system cell cycle response regulator CpdR
MPRLLVADDDPTMRDIVTRALAAVGHEVRAVADGQEALDAITASPDAFTLLVADVDMPLLNGIDLAARAAAVAPGLKILLMSGLAAGQARAHAAQDAAALNFIAKPFAIEDLRAAVRKLIG